MQVCHCRLHVINSNENISMQPVVFEQGSLWAGFTLSRVFTEQVSRIFLRPLSPPFRQVSGDSWSTGGSPAGACQLNRTRMQDWRKPAFQLRMNLYIYPIGLGLPSSSARWIEGWTLISGWPYPLWMSRRPSRIRERTERLDQWTHEGMD